MSVVTRFAPSPSGLLHLGHAYSARMAWNRAKAEGGRFLLRIEDIDTTRCKPEFEAQIVEDLRWLGFSWEEPVIRQTDRLAAYDARLAALAAEGWVYRCFRTRKDIAEILSAPHHLPDRPFVAGPLPGAKEARHLGDGIPFSWRLDSRRAAALADGLAWQEETDAGVTDHPVDLTPLGDVILGRKDIGTSYHIAAVHDDLDQGITHVVRGQDLADIAPLHRLLIHLFGDRAPVYRHHRLITAPDGTRLAKRDRAATIASRRAAGDTQDDLWAELGLPPL